VAAWLGDLARDPDRRALWLRSGLTLMIVVAVSGGGIWGLQRLEENVILARGLDQPPAVHVDAPPELKPALNAALERVADTSWSNPNLCEQIGDALSSSGWVRRVESVRRLGDGSVSVQCGYRQPVALVQTASGCYLVDSDDIRLPGHYACDNAFIIVQGVRSAPPEAGEAWSAADMQAGRRIAELLATEPFGEQIIAVRVHNYSGREDQAAPHIVLATDRAGGTIYWGSAIGQEVEENSAAQKIELLRANYREFGRVDAYRAAIDVSILPDRVVIPAS